MIRRAGPHACPPKSVPAHFFVPYFLSHLPLDDICSLMLYWAL